ncbi:MAG: single-stranded-DNA-specific exonuclease RecJ [Candidatus Delongbacteria bacterium]|nr:single-stranded-DNA-specific exonuclease RecJ [Candidatus Delongbacteria bacterium]MCG2761041.1 single-stranded-DNA-specific exonuclease RecJ [Candidatus Delongbacteria bacterium]
MEKKWEYPNELDSRIIEELKIQTELPEAIVRLLVVRNLTTKEEIELFLYPERAKYHEPFLLKDMDKAVERIIEALVSREKIEIWGDYDVDGITSTGMLYLFFIKWLGLKVDYVIPNRESDGYGLSKSGIKEAYENGITLIITVDCGITSVNEVEFAKSLGVDIIITDHHEPDKELPAAYAIIDPKRTDCTYPFKHLAGVGVAFKLIQGILTKNEMPMKIISEFLDIATIGTAADIVPLIGENRKIVSDGLKYLENCKNIGISALLKKLNFFQKKIKVSNILFGLAPRLNAVGRMGDANRAVKLLLSNDPIEADQIVEELEFENRRRREFDTDTLIEAIKIVEDKDHFDPSKDKAIIVANENWHVGVIGIVASRLVEKYYRPSVVISVNNGIGKGSCRSIPGVNIYDVLTECYKLNLLEQENFGGHDYAAGFEIDSKNIPAFKNKFNEIISTTIPNKDFEQVLKIDLKIDFEDINSDLMEKLKMFEPYGTANEQPIFATENVEIIGEIRIVGNKSGTGNKRYKTKDNHLKMKIRQGNIVFDAIGFNIADKFDLVSEMRSLLKIAYFIEENTWNNNSYIQLKLQDITT